MRSTPSPELMVSFPAPESMRSELTVPFRVSAPDVPTIVFVTAGKSTFSWKVEEIAAPRASVAVTLTVYGAIDLLNKSALVVVTVNVLVAGSKNSHEGNGSPFPIIALRVRLASSLSPNALFGRVNVENDGLLL